MGNPIMMGKTGCDGVDNLMGRDRKRAAMQQWPHSRVRHGLGVYPFPGRGEWSGLAPLLQFEDRQK